mgnify:CR=1 FL=1
MRLDDFLKVLDSNTLVDILLVPADINEETVSAKGDKQEVILTIISKDISDFNMFEIYQVSYRMKKLASSDKWEYSIFILAKENY